MCWEFPDRAGSFKPEQCAAIASETLLNLPPECFECSECKEHDGELSAMCVRDGCPKEHEPYTEVRFCKPPFTIIPAKIDRSELT